MIRLIILSTVLTYLIFEFYFINACAHAAPAKPEENACVADDALPEFKGAREKPDWRCAISPKQLEDILSKNSDTTLIDIRHKKAFDLFHINGAINLRLAEIKTKTYLKGRHLILVGNGKGERALFSACAELKALGWKNVHVLKGGMITWLTQAKPVIGRAPDVSQLASLTPSDLFRESRFLEALILITPGGARLKSQWPVSISLKNDRILAIKEVLAKLDKKTNLSNVQSIVIVANPQFNTSQITGLIKLAQPRSLLVYRETDTAYLSFVRTQTAMWNKQPKSKKCGAL